MSKTMLEKSNILNAPVECFYYDAEAYPFPVQPHWHYYVEMLLIMKGCARVQSETETYLLKKGELILIYPKNVHSIEKEGKEELYFAVLKFDINRFNNTASYAPKLRSIFKAAEKAGMTPCFSSDYVKDQNIPQLLDSCIYEMNKKDYGYDQLIASKVYEILIKMLRFWLVSGFSIDQQVYAEDNNYDIYNITEYIDEYIGEGIQVTDVAEQCKLSYSCFAKKFRAIYGKSCKDYMEQIRLYKVEALLKFTDFDLNYISQETGYSDCSHMIKSFKRTHNITPKQYRMKRV